MRRMATWRFARSGPFVGILEVLFSVTLCHEVFGRDIKIIGKNLGDRLSAVVRIGCVIHVGAHGVGVALDHKDLFWIAINDPVDRRSDALEYRILVGCHVRCPELRN